MTRTLLLAAIPLVFGGCMTGGSRSAASAATDVARVALADANGAPRGLATITSEGGGLMLHVEAEGLPRGEHGIHIHAVGRCDAPDFQTAGGHWNPSARQHGRDNPQGSHHGDLPNISIGPDGRGMLHATVPAASLDELFDADGAALVVHAGPDDYRTDPSGNSGGRIACGVIRRG